MIKENNRMKCPYCNRDMSTGYLYSESQPNQWIPDGKKPSIWRRTVADNGVELINKSGITGYKAAPHYCNNCKIVIAPTK